MLSMVTLITSNCSASVSFGASITNVLSAVMARALVSVLIGALTDSCLTYSRR